MKFGISLSLLLVGSLMAKAAPPAPSSQNPMIQVTVEYIEVTQEEATRLLYKEKLGKDGAKLRAELQAMMESGRAKPFETLMASCKAQQKATSESIREVIYATEYEPAELPTYVGVEKETIASPDLVKALSSLVTPETPTAFETRNTGGTVELEAVLTDDKKTIQLRLVPELVIDTGVKKFNARKDAQGNDLFIEMPLFYAIRFNTAADLSDGAPQLLSLQTPPGPDGAPDRSRKLMVIVTAEAVKAAPSK